jgi:hypothetical protein
MDLPSIRQLLTQISDAFSSDLESTTSSMQNMDDDVIEQKDANQNEANMFANGDDRNRSNSNTSNSNSNNNNNSNSNSNSTDNMQEEEKSSSNNIRNSDNHINTSSIESLNVSWFQAQFQQFLEWLRVTTLVLRLFICNCNLFSKNSDCDQPLCIISERFNDHSMRKIMHQSSANVLHICRSCIAGAIKRYVEDTNVSVIDLSRNNSSSDWRFLEQFDLSPFQANKHESKTAIDESSVPVLPVFGQWMSLTSVSLAIDESTPRTRLNQIIHSQKQKNTTLDEYRIAYCVDRCFHLLRYLLPDLLVKKCISNFVQNHTIEMCYFQFDSDFMLGNEPCDDLRIIKTSVHIPCLCVSTYNDHISLDLCFSDAAITHPPALIHGFLAEMEDLESMYAR